MVNRIGTVYSRVQLGVLCGLSSANEIPEEGRRTYRSKCYEYYNKDEINGVNILSNNRYN